MSFSYLIYLYILICIALIAFELGWLIYYALREFTQKNRTQQYEQFLRSRCEALAACGNTTPLTAAGTKKFRRILTHSHKMLAFACAYQNVSRDFPDVIRQSVSEIDDAALFFMKHVSRRTRVPSKIYFLKLYADMTSYTGENRPSDLISYQLRFLTNRSVVCRAYAMNILYTVGSPKDLLRAILLLSEKGLFYHPKVLMEGLISFRGDHRVLSLLLLRDFNRLSEEYKLAVLDYFRYKSVLVGPFLLDFLYGKYSVDIKCTVLRYFLRNPIPEAKLPIMELLENDENHPWEIAAIAAKALKAFPEPDVKTLLKKKISHPNWYIRSNAAESLVSIGLFVSEQAEIMNGRDQFAKEILEYNLRLMETSAPKKDGKQIPSA